jgi:DNA-binding response OmpR family regulator
MPKVLVADDEPGVIQLLRQFLKANGYEVVTASNGEQALEKIQQEDLQMVLLDFKMPGKNGIDVLKEIKKERPDICVILFTGLSDEEIGPRAIAAGADDFIKKPFNLNTLQNALWWRLKGFQIRE